MAFDPDHPPIWARKLDVSAAQISPTDYPATPAGGILAVCRLSDAQRNWILALRHAQKADHFASAGPMPS